MTPKPDLPIPPGGRPHPEDEEAQPTKDRQPVGRPLPHERDEAPEPEASEASRTGPREITGQAARDIARGLRDTDLKGTPSDVPGPGTAPKRTAGADVPRGGVHRDK